MPQTKSVKVELHSEREDSTEEDFSYSSTSYVIEKLVEGGNDIIFTPNREQEHYVLVYALFSSTDSFSHQEGNIEFIGIYSDVWKAEETKKAALESKKLLQFEVEDGQGGFNPITIHPPWVYNFTKLSSVHTVILKLEKIQ